MAAYKNYSKLEKDQKFRIYLISLTLCNRNRGYVKRMVWIGNSRFKSTMDESIVIITCFDLELAKFMNRAVYYSNTYCLADVRRSKSFRQNTNVD